MLKNIRKSEGWSEKSALEQGFTLVELLIVIAILGILAVVGILSFQGLTDTAKNSTAQTELSQVQTAVDAYLAQDPANTSPADVAALQTAGVLKSGTLQCSYDIAAGVVSFSATQSDPNCA